MSTPTDMESKFEENLQKGKDALKINFELKQEQRLALEALYSKKDVLCMLRTGYGKSLIYQLTPYVLTSSGLSHSITLVISPLNAIMKDQVRNLCKSGVPACFLDMKT